MNVSKPKDIRAIVSDKVHDEMWSISRSLGTSMQDLGAHAITSWLEKYKSDYKNNFNDFKSQLKVILNTPIDIFLIDKLNYHEYNQDTDEIVLLIPCEYKFFIPYLQEKLTLKNIVDIINSLFPSKPTIKIKQDHERQYQTSI